MLKLINPLCVHLHVILLWFTIVRDVPFHDIRLEEWERVWIISTVSVLNFTIGVSPLYNSGKLSPSNYSGK